MNSIVKLNVGGTIFHTSKSTCEQLQYFRSMFDGNFKIIKDDNDNIFIDRDPELFKYILSFLRNKEIEQFNKYYEKRTDLIHELNFYGLEIPELKSEVNLLNEYIIFDHEMFNITEDNGHILIAIEDQQTYIDIKNQLINIKNMIETYNNMIFLVIIFVNTDLNGYHHLLYRLPYGMKKCVTIKIIPNIGQDILYQNIVYKWSDRDIIDIYNDIYNLILSKDTRRQIYDEFVLINDKNQFNLMEEIINHPNVRTNFYKWINNK